MPVVTTGILPTDAATVIRQHFVPILGPVAGHSRARITRLSEPGLIRPIVAQVDVRLGHHGVRAQVAAATMSEVVGLLATRTIEQLQLFPTALARCLRERPATSPPPWPPELRPPHDRRLARHKNCRLTTMTVGEAIAMLETMDYRFHLFRERYSGQDSVVVRAGSGSRRILQPVPNPIGIDLGSPPLVLAAAPRSSVAAARARLDLTGAPFEVFTDKAIGRACVLYARYDGHYGILRPTGAARRSA